MKTSHLTRIRFLRTPFGRPIPRRLRTFRCESSPPGRAKVKFTIPHHVEFGQSICVSGSEEELGSWQLEDSYPLEWTQGDVWTGVVELPSKLVEYKYVTVNGDGSPAEWQSCENFVADIKNGDLLEITDCWDGATHETTTTSADEETPKIEAIQEEVEVDTVVELQEEEEVEEETSADETTEDEEEEEEDEEESSEEETSAEVED